MIVSDINGIFYNVNPVGVSELKKGDMILDTFTECIGYIEEMGEDFVKICDGSASVCVPAYDLLKLSFTFHPAYKN